MNRFIISESEKNRILNMHNKYRNKPQSWLINEEFSGSPGDGYDGDVEACKRDLPYNVAVKTGQIKSSAEWRKLRQEWGSDGSIAQNLKMRDEMCDGWRSGDKFPEEEEIDVDVDDDVNMDNVDLDDVDLDGEENKTTMDDEDLESSNEDIKTLVTAKKVEIESLIELIENDNMYLYAEEPDKKEINDAKEFMNTINENNVCAQENLEYFQKKADSLNEKKEKPTTKNLAPKISENMGEISNKLEEIVSFCKSQITESFIRKYFR